MAGPEAPPADVTVGAQAFGVDGGGAFPLEVEAPPGAPFTLRFAQAAAGGAALDWGALLNPMQRMTVLELAGVRVQRPGEADRIYACGASPRAVAWRTPEVQGLKCQPTLRLQGLDLAPDGGKLVVMGSGFVVENGEPRALSWKKVADNPLVSGLAGAAYAGLVGWTIKMLLANPAGAPSPAQPKTRRRATKPVG